MGRRRLYVLVVTSLIMCSVAAGRPLEESQPRSQPQKKWTKKRAAAAIAELAEEYRRFLDEVAVLITDEEQQEFLELSEDHERELFVRTFWNALDARQGTPRRSFRALWARRIEDTRAKYGEVTSARAKVFLVRGPADFALEGHCTTALYPNDIVAYYGIPDAATSVVVFVDRSGNGRFETWKLFDNPQWILAEPLSLTRNWYDSLGPEARQREHKELARWLSDGRRELAKQGYPSPPRGIGIASIIETPESQKELLLLLFAVYKKCWRDSILANLLLDAKATLTRNPTVLSQLAAFDRGVLVREEAWLERFRASKTDVDADDLPLESAIGVAYPGSHQSRTIVEAALQVAPSTDAAAGLLNPRYEISGEVLDDDGKLFESFQYVFELSRETALSATGPAQEQLHRLTFRRLLRPGHWSLVVRIREASTGAVDRHELDLAVPRAPMAVEPSLNTDKEATLDEVSSLVGSDSVIRLLVPEEAFFAGYQRFDAQVTGDVARVAFLLDGKEVGAKRSPPYSLELDLGPFPRPLRIEAVAEDTNGQPIGRDAADLNVGARRFSVDLLEPVDGEQHLGRVPVRALVSLPEGQPLDRLELFVDQELVKTLTDAPFVDTIDVADRRLTLVRAVAHLTDGSSTEDTALINAPGASERVRVHLVELFLAAERAGERLHELSADEITVLEEGEPQTLLRFERVDDLPLHLALLIDTSGSMAQEIESAQSAALKFFQESVRPRDRVAVVTFDRQPELRVDFTNQLAAMREGLRVLTPGRDTAFHDSVVYGLYQLQGLTGQRALFVLSDGRDSASRLTAEEALEYARRSGVAIYPIALKAEKGGKINRSFLNSLAKETGGRAFVVQDLGELQSIYHDIDLELRSRFLAVYQSAVDDDGDRHFRRIDVRARDPKVKVRAAAGYYP